MQEQMSSTAGVAESSDKLMLTDRRATWKVLWEQGMISPSSKPEERAATNIPAVILQFSTSTSSEHSRGPKRTGQLYCCNCTGGNT